MAVFTLVLDRGFQTLLVSLNTTQVRKLFSSRVWPIWVKWPMFDVPIFRRKIPIPMTDADV